MAQPVSMFVCKVCNMECFTVASGSMTREAVLESYEDEICGECASRDDRRTTELLDQGLIEEIEGFVESSVPNLLMVNAIGVSSVVIGVIAVLAWIVVGIVAFVRAVL